MNKAETLKTIRNLTPDKVLFSPRGRPLVLRPRDAVLRISLLQLAARLLPGRFAVWLSLLDDGRLERQVRVKFGPRSLVPSSGAYDVPRLHLIVERGDWLALQADALRAIEQSPDSSPSQEQRKSGLSLKPIFDLLRRLDRDLAGVRGRIRINLLDPDHTRTLTLALNDAALSPTGSFFDVDVPRLVLDRILTGELDLSSALLRSRIRVGGDTGLAAQLVNAVNPPPAYPPGLPTPNTYVALVLYDKYRGLSDHPLDRKAINFYHTDLERVPFFYRGGYAVPQGPAMQYVDELPLDPLTLHIVPDEAGRVAYTMIDDDEIVVVSGVLRDGTFDLQLQSGPRGLALHIYAAEKIERVACNGQEVKPRQVGVHHYAAEFEKMKIRSAD